MCGFGLPLSKGSMRLPNKIGGFKQTQGTETSEYLEERTSTQTPLVVASERGPGQWRMGDNRNRLESRALAGDSPGRVMEVSSVGKGGRGESSRNIGGPRAHHENG